MNEKPISNNSIIANAYYEVFVLLTHLGPVPHHPTRREITKPHRILRHDFRKCTFPRMHCWVRRCGYNWTDKKSIYKWNECDIVLMLAESENAVDPQTNPHTRTLHNYFISECLSVRTTHDIKSFSIVCCGNELHVWWSRYWVRQRVTDHKRCHSVSETIVRARSLVSSYRRLCGIHGIFIYRRSVGSLGARYDSVAGAHSHTSAILLRGNNKFCRECACVINNRRHCMRTVHLAV